MLLATTLPGCRAPGPFKGSFVLGDSVRMLKPIVLDVIPIHFVDAILQLIVVDGRSLKTYPAQHVLDVSELFCCCARLLCNVRVLYGGKQKHTSQMVTQQSVTSNTSPYRFVLILKGLRLIEDAKSAFALLESQHLQVVSAGTQAP